MPVAGAAVLRRQLSHLHQSHGEFGEFDDRNFQIHGQTLLYLFILFSLILFATLLLLYARWFLRLRHLPSAPQFTLPLARPAPPPPSAGLRRAAINSIPIVLHHSSDLIDGQIHDLECCICLGMFEDGDKVKVLPTCEHRYHCDCIDAWLNGHSNCPLCRLPLAFFSR